VISLELYDDGVGLDWRWQSVGDTGIATGLAVGGANVHDIRLLQSTIRDALMQVLGVHYGVNEHSCIDEGYVSAAVRSMVENVFDDIPHVRTRGEKKKSKRKSQQRARRWVVERTHSWMNRFRAVLVRCDKKLRNNIAGLRVTCAYITFKRAGV
jgi:putative transposase